MIFFCFFVYSTVYFFINFIKKIVEYLGTCVGTSGTSGTFGTWAKMFQKALLEKIEVSLKTYLYFFIHTP